MLRESDPNLNAGAVPDFTPGAGSSTGGPELSQAVRYMARRPKKSLVVFQWVVILIASAGFIFKFVEFGNSVFNTTDEAVNFALTPLVMYVCVAIGFFSLFIWSMLRGDYKDIELPKYRFFEREMLADIEEEKYQHIPLVKGSFYTAISKN